MKSENTYFTPKAVNDIFVEITKLSRCSGYEDPLRTYVADFVQNLKAAGKPVELVHYNPTATELGDRVIVARKAAAPGYENYRIVVLQAHMDMVCKPNCDIFPLKLYEYTDDNGVEWLKAGSLTPKEGTTLGADDGIGVATALAILADDSLTMGPIECLFTVEEETTMGGAANFNKDWLKGRTYINLDSEDKDIITYGSAGGIKSHYLFTPILQSVTPSELKCLTLHIYNLKGGHSGVNINDGRANAIKLMTRALAHFNKRMPKIIDIEKTLQTNFYDFNLCSFNSNDTDNSIPNDATVTIAVHQDDAVKFSEDFIKFCQILSKEYEGMEEPKYGCTISDFTAQDVMFDDNSTDRFLNLLLVLPHGVVKMNSQIKTLVETSTNLAIVQTSQIASRATNIVCSHRSSTDSGLEYITQIHQGVAAVFDLPLTLSDWYPAWTPNEDSPLLKIARSVYAKRFGSDAKSEVIHAGLECGWVVDHYKNDSCPMDCISIGPTLQEPHTPDERLQTASVQEHWDCLLEILHELMK